jgi:hypothetical protein
LANLLSVAIGLYENPLSRRHECCPFFRGESAMEFDSANYDDNVPREPRRDYIQEVRNLFQVSVLTDVTVYEHTDQCLQARGERPCRCPVVPIFYIGRRAEPEHNLKGLGITPSFLTLVELEAYCENNIERLRSKAQSESQNQV